MAMIPRVSIGLMMAIVFLVAAEFAIVKSLWNTSYAAIAVVTLPMINLLVLALPRVQDGEPVAYFWRGFEAGGWLMALLVGLLGWIGERRFFWPTEFVDG